MSDQSPEFSNESEQTGASRRSSRVLRLLRSGDPAAFQNPELQHEFTRLFELLERIEEIAEEEYKRRAPEDSPQVEPESERSETDFEPGPGDEIEFEDELFAFDPQEFTGVPETVIPWEPEPDPWHEPAQMPVEEPSQSDPSIHQSDPSPTSDEGEHLERWWVNFNGDVSLERLARLRQVLSDSPFTIEARFDEISDGLIVLSVATEKNLTVEQVDWLVRQVMELVGLNRNAAILSRN